MLKLAVAFIDVTAWVAKVLFLICLAGFVDSLVMGRRATSGPACDFAHADVA